MPPIRGNRVVGIDASRMQVHQRTGTEHYSNHIIRGLLAEDVDWQWRLYLNGPADGLPLPASRHVDLCSIPAPRLWTHYRLSREMLRHPPDVLFVPAHVIPIVHPRTVVTIHDLGYLHVPEAHPARQRAMLDVTTRWSAKTARHIIVPSSRTRDDLITHYRVPEHRISVVHHGVDPRFRDGNRGRETELRERLGLRRPYILAVGTIQPRKNLPILARAMVRTGIDHDLVIAGKRGWMADQVLAEVTASGLGERLHLLDYIPDDDLPALYAAADIFVQPSHFEGFGMPVLEAMAAGTPVLCAAGSSLTEIAGDAADFFPPDDETSLGAALDRLLRDRDHRQSLHERGVARSSRFTWERAASETRSILERTLT